MEDIKPAETRLNDLVEIIKKNASALLEEHHSNQTLIQSATSRGFQILKGSMDKQLYVDLCAIALTVVIQNER